MVSVAAPGPIRISYLMGATKMNTTDPIPRNRDAAFHRFEENGAPWVRADAQHGGRLIFGPDLQALATEWLETKSEAVETERRDAMRDSVKAARASARWAAAAAIITAMTGALSFAATLISMHRP
jgi:hypothetical protein